MTALDRQLIAFRRRNSQIRHLIPLRVIRGTLRAQSWFNPVRDLFVRPVARSPHANVFHCCTQKSGSQWLQSLLTDLRTYQYTGLRRHDARNDRSARTPVTELRIPDGFPPRTLVSPLFMTFDAFREMPKAGSYRAFYVSRDPRDILVSWYYSARFSHLADNDMTRPLVQARVALEGLSEADGLRYAVDYMERMGRFASMRSWTNAPEQDPSVRLVRFEDLVGPDAFVTMAGLFDFLDIRMPESELRSLLDAYSFERLSGRKRGTENPRSHLRSGSAGGWRKRFDEPLTSYFREVTGDLVERMGYTW
ncbi:MAG TPA: sulfotransferase domain-containing protein [Longimicrobiales bacterium]|nr:sulfotransferase domain-containing protein [Longimicrobiales bacterium]